MTGRATSAAGRVRWNVSSLTPIGPQPPTQPGWYWMAWTDSFGHLWMVVVEVGDQDDYGYPCTPFIRWRGDIAFVETLAKAGYHFQPVAAPVMEEA